MELISCGKNIQLHSFPSLKTVSTYGSIEGHGCYDFQIFRRSKFFVAANPQLPAIEYLSLKTQGTISSVRKMKMENLTCIACPKSGLDLVALGLSTGHMRLMNYKTKDVAYRFAPDVINNSIVSMDFSSTDDHLACASDTGQIKIYGMKSFIEVDSFNIDKNSTLVRFHPGKRFQLAVASYLGCVSIYDVSSKKRTFHLRPHSAPCRDVCASPINENCLFSIGYDCFINIYDIRTQSVAQQLKCESPLSAVALSPSALECVVGNLKGEIITYDVRKLAQSVTKSQCHENLVSRLTFVPTTEGTEISLASTASAELREEVSAATSLNESVDVFNLLPILEKNRPNEPKRRDSFADFLDTVNSVANHRNSLDAPNPGKSTDVRDSLDFSNITLRKKRRSGQQEVNLSEVKEVEEEAEEKIPEVPECEAVQEVVNAPQLQVNGVTKVNERLKSPSQSFSHLIPNSNSTPNRMSDQANGDTSAALKDDILKEVTKMLKKLEGEIKYEVNTLNWKTYSEMFNLWQHHDNHLEKLCEDMTFVADGMNQLLHENPIVAELYRLQDENQALRNQLAAMQNHHNNS